MRRENRIRETKWDDPKYVAEESSHFRQALYSVV